MTNFICAKCGKNLSEDELEKSRCNWCKAHPNDYTYSGRMFKPRGLSQREWKIIDLSLRHNEIEQRSKQQIDRPNQRRITKPNANANYPFDPNHVGYYKGEKAETKQAKMLKSGKLKKYFKGR